MQGVIRRKRETDTGDRHYFATAAKGVEEVLAGELRDLGIEDVRVETGGVRFTGDRSACYLANLRLRTATRVLVPVAEFPCDTPQSLYDGVRAIPWHDRLTPDMTLAVECTLRDSAMTHSGFVALKTKDAIVDTIRDRCGRRPNVDVRDPDLRVNVHLAKNHCTVSLDASGTPLDRRGYRLDRTEAPLRETLAAALVAMTGWDGSVPFVDPMCGSGTIPIEAALKASRRAPGLMGRRFGFQRWPDYDPALWQRLSDAARQEALAALPAPVTGCDRSATALETARRNADRAGVSEIITFVRSTFREFSPPAAPGVLLFNPPYGLRLGEEEELKSLYREIGDTMKQRYAGYTAFLLTGSRELAKHVGLKASRRIVLFNGPIECRLLRYELY